MNISIIIVIRKPTNYSIQIMLIVMFVLVCNICLGDKRTVAMHTAAHAEKGTRRQTPARSCQVAVPTGPTWAARAGGEGVRA